MTAPASGSGPNVHSGLQRLWQELGAADTRTICARSGASFAGRRYSVEFLGRSYGAELGECRISGPPGDRLPEDSEFGLLILGYLIHAREVEVSGAWVSERQLPGGSLFFQGPHALPLTALLERYGRDAEAFGSACGRLGGKPLDFGDASFAFQALPRIPLAVVLWVADEEFPARLGVLFDSTAALHLPLDLVLALVHAVTVRLESAATGGVGGESAAPPPLRS